MRLFEIDPTTDPWTINGTNHTGNLPKPQPIVMRKMVWMPGLSAVMLVDQADRNIYLYKF
jgi:hypothetical protein